MQFSNVVNDVIDMAGFFDENNSFSINDYSFVNFELVKVKYSNFFRLDSIRRHTDEKHQRIDVVYTSFSGERVAISKFPELENMIQGFGTVIAFGDAENFRLYQVVMVQSSEMGNHPSFEILVLDTNAKTHYKDLMKLRAMPKNLALSKNALKKFKSMDLLRCEFLR